MIMGMEGSGAWSKAGLMEMVADSTDDRNDGSWQQTSLQSMARPIAEPG
jgi:hypothetical protein